MATFVRFGKHGGIRRAVIEGIGAVAATNLQRIPESLGGQQADFGPLLFQHRVRGDSGAVNEQRAIAEQGPEAHVEDVRRLSQRIEYAFRRIGRYRGNLDGMDLVVDVGEHQVGERAADVYADIPTAACRFAH